jgi:hypothetical protein
LTQNTAIYSKHVHDLDLKDIEEPPGHSARQPVHLSQPGRGERRRVEDPQAGGKISGGRNFCRLQVFKILRVIIFSVETVYGHIFFSFFKATTLYPGEI